MRFVFRNDRAKSGAIVGIALAIFFAMGSPLGHSGANVALAQNGGASSVVGTTEFNVAQYYPRRNYRRYNRYQRPRYRRPRYRRSNPRARRAPRRTPAPVTWKVDESNKDPVQLVVSLPKQRIKVYKGTELVVSSRVSSGKPGYSTPSGVFSILEKKRRHYSNLYGGAPMPNMQRLTWSGVALHASGDVPRHPASHGCVRLPPSFARQLFGFTGKGPHVIIANEDDVKPQRFTHAKLFQPLSRPAPIEPVGDDIETSKSEPPAKTLQTENSDTAETRNTPVRTASADKVDAATARDDSGSSMLVSEAAADSDGDELGANVAGAGAEDPPETKEKAGDPPSTSPIRILVTRRSGRERLKDMQQMLADLGHEPGDVDGFIGRDTVRAIKRFQKSRGLPENGMMTDELIARVYEVAGREEPTGHIYVRQDFKDVFSSPINIREFEKPLGTHFFAVMHHEHGATETDWTVVSLKDRVRKRRRSSRSKKQPVASTGASSTASEALDRIEIPDEMRARISRLLRPGSSFVISDKGLGPETGKGTDFIALTMR